MARKELNAAWRKAKKDVENSRVTAMCPWCGNVVQLTAADHDSQELTCDHGHAFENTVTFVQVKNGEPRYAKSRRLHQKPT